MVYIHTVCVYMCVYGWCRQAQLKGALCAGLQPLERGDIYLNIEIEIDRDRSIER